MHDLVLCRTKDQTYKLIVFTSCLVYLEDLPKKRKIPFQDIESFTSQKFQLPEIEFHSTPFGEQTFYSWIRLEHGHVFQGHFNMDNNCIPMKDTVIAESCFAVDSKTLAMAAAESKALSMVLS